MSKNNNNYWSWSRTVDIVLILGIVFLAALDRDGWGWLIFILLIKNA